MGNRGTRAFSEEFRREALRLIEAGEKPVAQLARELGVHHETLRGWRRRAHATGEPTAAAGTAYQLFETRGAANRAIFEYIEVWYNRQRRHSSLGYRSPAQYEEELQQASQLRCPRNRGSPNLQGARDSMENHECSEFRTGNWYHMLALWCASALLMVALLVGPIIVERVFMPYPPVHAVWLRSSELSGSGRLQLL